MNTWRKSMLVCAAVTALLGTQRTAGAIEPTDNAYPWSNLPYHGNLTTFVCASTQCGWGGIEAISPSGDNDYFMMVCGAGTVITQVWISFTGSQGDLDMQVWKPNGTFYGGSYGTGDQEIVNTSALNRSDVVMNVYGWAGATNSYTVLINCSST